MTVPITDCHAHLADDRIYPEIRDCLRESRERGLTAVLANAGRLSEWDRLLELGEDVDLALGIHPFHPEEWDDGVKARLLNAINQGQISAVGEIGLDYTDGRDGRDAQLRVFTQQLEIAVAADLPVCLHNRKSWNDFFGVVKDLGISKLRGYCHNFTGSTELARQLLELGLHISFAAPVTYKDAAKTRASAAFVPEDRILTETDCPGMPAALPSRRLSSPWHALYPLLELAAIRKEKPEELSRRIAENYNRLFRRK